MKKIMFLSVVAFMLLFTNCSAKEYHSHFMKIEVTYSNGDVDTLEHSAQIKFSSPARVYIDTDWREPTPYLLIHHMSGWGYYKIMAYHIRSFKILEYRVDNK